MCRVIEEWQPVKDKEIFILYLDEETPDKSYWNYRIGGKIYKPVPMTFSRSGNNVSVRERAVAIESNSGGFVGKEVEFVS